MDNNHRNSGYNRLRFGIALAPGASPTLTVSLTVKVVVVHHADAAVCGASSLPSAAIAPRRRREKKNHSTDLQHPVALRGSTVSVSRASTRERRSALHGTAQSASDRAHSGAKHAVLQPVLCAQTVEAHNRPRKTRARIERIGVVCWGASRSKSRTIAKCSFPARVCAFDAPRRSHGTHTRTTNLTLVHSVRGARDSRGAPTSVAASRSLGEGVSASANAATLQLCKGLVIYVDTVSPSNRPCTTRPGSLRPPGHATTRIVAFLFAPAQSVVTVAPCNNWSTSR